MAVNDTTADSPRWPDVALQPTGFVVTWSQVVFGGGATGDVRARLFAADGTPRGADFLVNSHTTGAQWRSRVAAGADGSFVVAWEDGFGVENGQDGSGVSVRAQRFGAGGALRGGEIAVNALATGFQRYPDIAAAADGRFVVTWESQEQDGSGIGIFGRRFAANGAAQGGGFPGQYRDGRLSDLAGGRRRRTAPSSSPGAVTPRPMRPTALTSGCSA